jgi:hypothetical protein
MSIMLNESNSSFDTMPSFDFILRRDDRDDEMNVSDVDETEGFHIIENEAERREEVGVLIVPPTSSSENSRNTVLSLPDSVPTVLNSGILDVPNSVHVVDDDGTSPIDKATLQLSTCEPFHPSTISCESKINESKVIGITRRRSVLTILFLASVSAGSISHACYLHRESRLLKEQVRLLKDQATLAAAALKELQQERDREVVIGNCWLHAHGKMSMGECSYEATESVKAQVKTLSSSFRTMWNQLKESYVDSVTASKNNVGKFSTIDRFNTTINTIGNNFHGTWTQLKDVFEGSFLSNKTKENDTIYAVQEIWNAIKRKSSDFKIKEQVNSVPTYVYEKLDSIKRVYNENVKEHINSLGRSLYAFPTMLIDTMSSGFKELNDSIEEEIVYFKSNYTTLRSSTLRNNTTNMNSTDMNSTKTYLSEFNELKSLSQKLLVAALWSTGAAILVSTLDMYWNQHGKLLALEN